MHAPIFKAVLSPTVFQSLRCTYETPMLTETPGACLSCVSKASVETISTKDADSPPCKVPPLFVCCSSTFISATHFPLPPEIINT